MSTTNHKKKPTGKEIGIIKRETLNNPVDMSMADIANEIGNNGRAFYPAILQGGMKRDNFVEMQWFALDFDNGEVTFENILQIANDYGISISFAYETFSSTQENQRFRVVFQHEFSIDNVQIAEILIGMLQKIFPYSDKCKKQVLFDIFRQFISGTFRQSKTSTFIIAYISRGLLPGFSCSIFFRFIEMVILHQDLIAEKLFPQVNPSE